MAAVLDGFDEVAVESQGAPGEFDRELVFPTRVGVEIIVPAVVNDPGGDAGGGGISGGDILGGSDGRVIGIDVVNVDVLERIGGINAPILADRKSTRLNSSHLGI